MNKRRLFKILPWLLAIALLVVVIRLVPLEDTWAAILRLGWRQIMILAILNGLILVLLNGRWWIILRGHGQRVPFLTLFGYRLATFGVSYFTPGPHFGGEPVQVFLVEKEHGTPRSTAVAAMTLDKTLELLVNFSFLLAGVIIIFQQRSVDAIVGQGMAAAASFLLLIPLAYLLALGAHGYPLSRLLGVIQNQKIWSRRPLWADRWQRAEQVVQTSEIETSRFMRRSPFFLILALLISIAAWGLMVWEFWLMVSFLGLSLTFLQLVTTLTAARVAILLLLPGSLGVLEASQILAFSALGLNPVVGISASLLIRARDVLLGATGLWWGTRKLAQLPSKKQTGGSLEP